MAEDQPSEASAEDGAPAGRAIVERRGLFAVKLPLSRGRRAFHRRERRGRGAGFAQYLARPHQTKMVDRRRHRHVRLSRPRMGAAADAAL